MVIDIRSLVPGQIKADLSKLDKSKKKESAASTSSASTEQDDSVSLTSQTTQLGQLIEQMKLAPALDMERVAPIKEKVDGGSYEIKYEQVANKMLDFETSYEGY